MKYLSKKFIYVNNYYEFVRNCVILVCEIIGCVTESKNCIQRFHCDINKAVIRWKIPSCVVPEFKRKQ